MSTKPQINLTDTYQLVATGPCIVTAKDMSVIRVHIGTVAPSSDTPNYHKTTAFTYPGTQRVYCRSDHGLARVVVTEVT